MLNWRNVSGDVSGLFNATIDFIKLVTNCHVIAAAMNFFGMKCTSGTSTNNTLPSDISKWPVQRQWQTYSEVINRIVDRYIIVDEFGSV